MNKGLFLQCSGVCFRQYGPYVDVLRDKTTRRFARGGIGALSLVLSLAGTSWANTVIIGEDF